MELFFVLVGLTLLAMPAAIVVLLARSFGMRRSLEELSLKVDLLRIRLDTLEQTDDASGDVRATAKPPRAPARSTARPAPFAEAPVPAAPVGATPAEGSTPPVAGGRPADHEEPITEAPAEDDSRVELGEPADDEAPAAADEAPADEEPVDDPSPDDQEPVDDPSPDDQEPVDDPSPDDEATDGRDRWSPHGEEERAARPAAAAADLETVIGTTWVLRIGLGVLAIALALFARTAAPLLSPAAKVALAYVAAIALFGAGRFYEHRLDRFARPVMGGALAFGFFVAFAAHFVPAMSAVSPTTSALWMGFSMVTVLIAAERWRSQGTAVLAFVLGHVSAYVAAGEADTYSLVMLAALAVTAAALMLRHQWTVLGVLGVAVSYGAHLLWILAERGPVDGEWAFWLNLAFLTAYYATFLAADVIWWRRKAEREPDAPDSFSSPRHIGPLNLVLYASVTSIVFVVTDAPLESIEWFYLSLAALQGVIRWLYGATDHRGFAFYHAVGTILWTLGMFAAFEALTLNLVLAAQALLLLVAAHRTRLWVLHGLAQATLVVGFVHYWLYPRPEASWPLFLGGLGVAALYLVKASLEEVWYDEAGEFEWWADEETPPGGVGAAFRDWFRPVAPVFAPVHATLAAIVLLRETLVWFGPGTDMAGFVAATGLVVVGAVAFRRRTALLFAPTFLLASAVVLVTWIDEPRASLLLVAGLFGALVALATAVGRRLTGPVAERVAWHAQVGAGLALFAAAVGSADTAWPFPAGAAWLVVPALALMLQELVAARVPGGMRVGTDEVDRRGPDTTMLLAGAAGLVTVWIMMTGVGTEPEVMVWVSLGTAAVMLASLLLESRRLFAAGYVLMILGYFFGLMSPAGGTLLAVGVLELPWRGALVALVPLAVAVYLDRAGPDQSWDPVTLDGRQVLTFGSYALGFAVVGAMGHIHLSSGTGWSKVAGAVVAVAVVASARRLRTPLAVPSVLAGLALLHAMVLGDVSVQDPLQANLIALLLFGALTLVAQRLTARARPDRRDTSFDRGVSFLLAALAMTTVMSAIYRSNPAWVTAGWSVAGGLLMVAGFVLASVLYRRIALVILAISLSRVFLVDTRELSDTAKILAFLVLGLSLLGVAWLYARFQERVKKWF